MAELHFSKFNHAERLKWLRNLGVLDEHELNLLANIDSHKFLELGDNLIENSIGGFYLPVGIVPYLNLNGKTYHVPMVTEETSVVAAASSIVKLINKSGNITSKREKRHIIGQVHFMCFDNMEKLNAIISKHRKLWIEMINTHICPGMFDRGGGAIDIFLREIPVDSGKKRAVIHLIFDPCDAMGANIINQSCEFLKNELHTLLSPEELPLMAILSNLNDQAVVTATITIVDMDPELSEKIEAASYCALTDPYRAATHNKGIFNAIDAILIATGNDWRAAEAAGHAYACKTGVYLPLSVWRRDGSNLVGNLEFPMVTGIVGGVTKIHPLAQISLKIMGINSADELDKLVVAMGLIQNLAALRALTSEGITRGHMELHIKNYLAQLAQTAEEHAYAAEKLKEKLFTAKHISMRDAVEIINEYRQNHLK